MHGSPLDPAWGLPLTMNQGPNLVWIYLHTPSSKNDISQLRAKINSQFQANQFPKDFQIDLPVVKQILWKSGLAPSFRYNQRSEGKEQSFLIVVIFEE